MRFFLVISIWVVIVGGLWIYTWQRDLGLVENNISTLELEESQAAYALEITPTFAVEKDPFALETDDNASQSLKISLNGTPVIFQGNEIERGRTIRIDPVEGVSVGKNEIFVTMSPPFSENALQNGVRVQLLENGIVIVDQTIWNNQGSLVSGSISFQISQLEKEEHEH